ncbi:MAG: hypothetical protein ACI4DP_00300 [Candidatus Ornithomonoglobus sp.]
MRMIYTNPEIDIRIFELEEIGTTEGNDPVYASSNAYNPAQKQVAETLGGQAQTASYIFTFE